MSYVEGQQNEGNTSDVDGEGEGSTSRIENQLDGDDVQPQQSQAAAAHVQALQRRKIAQLEEKLEVLQSGRAVKERCGR
jgi:polyhydroxyalkanoate synthesis regulator phasin